ncbi:unnamed protein product [Medioppia subpectinata]|uniref:Cytochrome P450 n=1 Tax=Medioppia subpectinata TaxID=1979941 RepID=A0A7R9KZ07_9ACAR|nr:unnamed protein product [Medioppia subpectinata]CAG2112261.1 unnamed protein product [Medioppia subpectinata]
MKYLTRNFNYFTKLGVKGPRPLPIFGNLWERLFTSLPELDIKWQRKYGKIYGVYDGNEPILMVTDPELIKHILVKDFHIFQDRFPVSKSNNHPIIGKMLTELRGDDWKRVRSVTTPVFTSVKLKAMYPTVRESAEGFATTLDKYAKDKGVINAKDLFGCYTMDVISNCGFAIKSDAFKDPNNPFVVNGEVIIEVPVWKLLLPEFALNILNIKTFLNEKSVTFFSPIVRQILKIREKSKTKSNDFIDLMMSVRHEANCIDDGEEESGIEKKILNIKASNKFITEDEMIAQGFIFFAAGNVTANNTMAFCSYELALNPEVQQKLYEEVMSSLDTNGEIDYEVLTKLAYLDAVIAETLRLHTPTIKVGRNAIQDYPLADTGITIPKGQIIQIPIYAIHYSEEYYPNPEEFIPDRFLPENRHNIMPYTYLPFSAGPRNCIGMRFALMEMKVGLAHIIRRFKFVRSPQTEVPVTIVKNIPLKCAKSLTVGIESRVY